MEEEKLQKMWTDRNIMLGLSLLLPMWLTLGRAALGSMGWFTFLLLIMFPLLALPLVTVLLFYLRRDVRESGHLPKGQAAGLWLSHIALFLAGLFMVDGGDTSDSIGSVFTIYAGSEFRSLSETLFSGTLGLGALLLGICFLDGLWSVWKYRKGSSKAS